MRITLGIKYHVLVTSWWLRPLMRFLLLVLFFNVRSIVLWFLLFVLWLWLWWLFLCLPLTTSGRLLLESLRIGDDVKLDVDVDGEEEFVVRCVIDLLLFVGVLTLPLFFLYKFVSFRTKASIHLRRRFLNQS